MKEHTPEEFQRLNSRRLWTAVGFLVVLVVVALISFSYVMAGILAKGGGVGLISEIGRSSQCGRERLMPLAEALDRYARSTGHYPERVKDVFPVYLDRESILHCPSDQATPDGESSFTYRRPEPGQSDPVILECRHHGSFLLRVRARGRLEPGQTLWELQMQPLNPPGKK